MDHEGLRGHEGCEAVEVAPVVLSLLIALTVTVSVVRLRDATTRTRLPRASTATVVAVAVEAEGSTAGSGTVQERVLATSACGTWGTARTSLAGPLIER